MPHNLYLHSAVIQTRAYERSAPGRRRAIVWGTVDSTLSLVFAFLVNSAILILAAAAFYYSDNPHRCAARAAAQHCIAAAGCWAARCSSCAGPGCGWITCTRHNTQHVQHCVQGGGR